MKFKVVYPSLTVLNPTEIIEIRSKLCEIVKNSPVGVMGSLHEIGNPRIVIDEHNFATAEYKMIHRIKFLYSAPFSEYQRMKKELKQHAENFRIEFDW